MPENCVTEQNGPKIIYTACIEDVEVRDEAVTVRSRVRRIQCSGILCACDEFTDIVFYNRTEEEYAKARELAALFYEVAPVLISADFYALTPCHKIGIVQNCRKRLTSSGVRKAWYSYMACSFLMLHPLR